MVEVGVRVDERDGGEAVPRERFEDPVGLVAGIDDDGLPGRGVGHDAQLQPRGATGKVSTRTSPISASLPRASQLGPTLRPMSTSTAAPPTSVPTPSPSRRRPCAAPWPRPRSGTTSTARTRPSPAWRADGRAARLRGGPLRPDRLDGKPDRPSGPRALRHRGHRRGAEPRLPLRDGGDGRALGPPPAPGRRAGGRMPVAGIEAWIRPEAVNYLPRTSVVASEHPQLRRRTVPPRPAIEEVLVSPGSEAWPSTWTARASGTRPRPSG